MIKLTTNLLRKFWDFCCMTKLAISHVFEYVDTNGYDPDTCSDMALKSVTGRPDILTKRREKLLLKIILRELRRNNFYKQISLSNMVFLMRKGFVSFVDLGFSSDSLFSFFELGRITPGMYKELKNVHSRFRYAFDAGEGRKQELQRHIYDNLMLKRMNFVFASLP